MADEQIFNEIVTLRNQGLPDNLINAELSRRGYPMPAIQSAMADMSLPLGDDSGSYQQQSGYPDNYGQTMQNQSMPQMQGMPQSMSGMPLPPGMQSGMSRSRQDAQSGDSGEGNIYDKIEEITEGIVDEKWDELIAEVKKIVQWKEKLEEKQNKLINDVDKLKEDFNILHEGILGRLETYDERMQEVGVELKAVGKVFKDVIPVFVDNVKELKSIKDGWKGK